MLGELRERNALVRGSVDPIARADQALQRNGGRQVHRPQVSPAGRELVKARGVRRR